MAAEIPLRHQGPVPEMVVDRRGKGFCPFALCEFGREVNDQLKLRFGGKILDGVDDVLLGIRVQLFFMEGRGIKRVIELHDGGELDLDQDLPVHLPVHRFNVGHRACRS